MGRNTAIKHYDLHPEGQPLDLFTSVCRAPVLDRLLESPWIQRASELVADSAAPAGKRSEEQVEVAWEARAGAPSSFIRRGRTLRVREIAMRWSVERAWWDTEKRVSLRCFRVVVIGGGSYDLVYDRVTKRWSLSGIVD